MDNSANIFQFKDYRVWLSSAFANRIERNPQLSVSSLATKIGMSQSLLSLILRGKRKLTFQRAEAVASYLELNSREKTYLNLLIQFEQTQEVNSRSAISRKLDEFAAGDLIEEAEALGEVIRRVVYSNPEQIALAREAMSAFADELESILSRGEKTSFVNLSLTLH